MVVWAAVMAISFAFAVIPSPPITLTVAEPPSVIEPPPVNPVPAVTVTASEANWAIGIASFGNSMVVPIIFPNEPVEIKEPLILVPVKFNNSTLFTSKWISFAVSKSIFVWASSPNTKSALSMEVIPVWAPANKTAVPSTVIAPAEALAIVVSLACPNSILPNTSTSPVVVIVSINASFQRTPVVPKSTSLSDWGPNILSAKYTCSTLAA